MIKTVDMTRLQGNSKSFNLSLVDIGYINLNKDTISFGRKTGNNRCDELVVSIADVKTAIAEYEAAETGNS